MGDYLIEQYNAKVTAIQDREAEALRAALEIYTAASNTILERAALERVEAGVELAAAMNQRDHEYHNGRPSAPERMIAAQAVLSVAECARADEHDGKAGCDGDQVRAGLVEAEPDHVSDL